VSEEGNASLILIHSPSAKKMMTSSSILMGLFLEEKLNHFLKK
jgi:hypothetical protein